MSSRTTAERVAVLETKIDAIGTHLSQQDEKLDKVLEGQQEGRNDRAAIKTRLADIESRIGKIEPDAKTIRDAKTVLKYGSWGVGVLATIGGAILTAKGWIVLNWQYLTGGR